MLRTRPRTSTDSWSTPDCSASSARPRAWWGCGCSGQRVPVCARQAEKQGPTSKHERCQSSRQAVCPRRMAPEPSARRHCGSCCTPCSACGCSDFGIWALHWTSSRMTKRPYAGIGPSKRHVAGVHPACRKTRWSFRLPAGIPYGSARWGEIRGRFGDRGPPQWQSPIAQYRYATFSHPFYG